MPGNREEKTLAGVILQQEVLVRIKELTSYHQPRFWRGPKEMGDSSPEVLPTFQDSSRWNPSRQSDECAPRKDANSEWLARDKPERNPMTIKPETVRFSPFPSGRAVLSVSLTLRPPYAPLESSQVRHFLRGDGPPCPPAQPLPGPAHGPRSCCQVKHLKHQQIHPPETIQAFYPLICL